MPLSGWRGLRGVGQVESILEHLGQSRLASYFVGGAPRDLLLGKAVNDVDIAARASFGKLKSLFPDYKAKDFGVAKWVTKDGQQIASLQSVRRDSLRRDFSINALYQNASSGRILDPQGGLADLNAGVVRAIGNPEARFAEDVSRIPRAMRFAGRFGFQIEQGTWEAAKSISQRAASGNIAASSYARFGKELEKLFEEAPVAKAHEPVIEGLKHGWAQMQGRRGTEFGSGWQGPRSIHDIINSRDTYYHSTDFRGLSGILENGAIRPGGRAVSVARSSALDWKDFVLVLNRRKVEKGRGSLRPFVWGQLYKNDPRFQYESTSTKNISLSAVEAVLLNKTPEMGLDLNSPDVGVSAEAVAKELGVPFRSYESSRGLALDRLVATHKGSSAVSPAQIGRDQTLYPNRRMRRHLGANAAVSPSRTFELTEGFGKYAQQVPMELVHDATFPTREAAQAWYRSSNPTLAHVEGREKTLARAFNQAEMRGHRQQGPLLRHFEKTRARLKQMRSESGRVVKHPSQAWVIAKECGSPSQRAADVLARFKELNDVQFELPWESRPSLRAFAKDAAASKFVVTDALKTAHLGVIEGLKHGGMAEKMRHLLTNFGSGWRGLVSLPDELMVQPGLSFGRKQSFEGLTLSGKEYLDHWLNHLEEAALKMDNWRGDRILRDIAGARDYYKRTGFIPVFVNEELRGAELKEAIRHERLHAADYGNYGHAGIAAEREGLPGFKELNDPYLRRVLPLKKDRVIQKEWDHEYGGPGGYGDMPTDFYEKSSKKFDAATDRMIAQTHKMYESTWKSADSYFPGLGKAMEDSERLAYSYGEDKKIFGRLQAAGVPLPQHPRAKASRNVHDALRPPPAPEASTAGMTAEEILERVKKFVGTESRIVMESGASRETVTMANKSLNAARGARRMSRAL